MGEAFTIQISSNLVKQLADEGEKLKKRSKKGKPKIPKETDASQGKAQQKSISEDPEMLRGPPAPAGWPPLYLPVPSQQPAISELDAIRSVLQDSEKVMDRLQKQEENMLQEVTQRAKDLHEKEFKLPDHKPIPCLEERDACTKCYKENEKSPLLCANAVKNFADCARKVKHLINTAADN